MFEAFFKDKLAPLALRVALGLVFASHGYLKIMANGGTNWTAGMSMPWQLLVAWGEFVTGLAILLGFRCRIAATSALVMTLAILFWQQGWEVFRMPITSLEPTFVLVVVATALILTGAGEIALDSRSGGRGGGAGRVAKKAG